MSYENENYHKNEVSYQNVKDSGINLNFNATGSKLSRREDRLFLDSLKLAENSFKKNIHIADGDSDEDHSKPSAAAVVSFLEVDISENAQDAKVNIAMTVQLKPQEATDLQVKIAKMPASNEPIKVKFGSSNKNQQFKEGDNKWGKIVDLSDLELSGIPGRIKIDLGDVDSSFTSSSGLKPYMLYLQGFTISNKETIEYVTSNLSTDKRILQVKYSGE